MWTGVLLVSKWASITNLQQAYQEETRPRLLKNWLWSFKKLYFEFQASLYKICTKNRGVLDPAITHDPKIALTTDFDKRQLDCLVPVGPIKVSLATLKHSY